MKIVKTVLLIFLYSIAGTAIAMEQPLKKEIQKKKFICSICAKGFSTVSYFYNHQKSHPELAIFKCTECSKSFFTKNQLDSHKKIHPELKYTFESCDICAQCFSSKRTLNRHKREKHSSSEISQNIMINNFSFTENQMNALVEDISSEFEHWQSCDNNDPDYKKQKTN